MTTHSSILTWEIPWTEEPGGLQSMGFAKNQTHQSDHTHTHTHTQYPLMFNEGEELDNGGCVVLC